MGKQGEGEVERRWGGGRRSIEKGREEGREAKGKRERRGRGGTNVE